MDWINEANHELAALEGQSKSDPKAFNYKDGVPRKYSAGGGPDGDGVKRAEAIAGAAESIARRARNLVSV